MSIPKSPSSWHYSSEERKRMTQTAKERDFARNKAVMPQFIRQRFPKGMPILDFGAGRNWYITELLTEEGYLVVPCDLSLMGSEKALSFSYPYLFLSCVFNIQPSESALYDLLYAIQDVAEGEVLFNYPDYHLPTYACPWSHLKAMMQEVWQVTPQSLGNKVYRVELNQPKFRLIDIPTASWLRDQILQQNPQEDLSLRSASRKIYSYGKKVGSDWYWHIRGLPYLPQSLQESIAFAASLLPQDYDFQLIKRTHAGQFSFLSYPTFDQDPHPAIDFTWIVRPDGSTTSRSYWQSASPFILHRKETFVPQDYPLYPLFAAFTKWEEAKGILPLDPKETNRIGTRQTWHEWLEQQGRAEAQILRQYRKMERDFLSHF